ncbi:gag protease polyprotein [Cucumis melo var. makuwa]|uniref:Gag protease polyprotein n=1 Tax=Cucumis melo var. makuwa TaxID=1194695 RepID=A0A5D3BGK1_CUCMM|nr:gag protease polyprotein [Cucumis melo var. makuwa]TYJ98169.1 gag protease polyprotein [Cucumis melo var. makuwa]
MLGGDVNQITWEQFKESFYAKFFSDSLRYAKQQEFLNLEQGNMTVEYCGRSHGGRCLVGSGVCYKCKQLEHIANFCPQKLFEATLNKTSTSQHRRVFATTRQEAEQAGTVVTGRFQSWGTSHLCCLTLGLFILLYPQYLFSICV